MSAKQGRPENYATESAGERVSLSHTQKYKYTEFLYQQKSLYVIAQCPSESMHKT